jgi:hypothetical protein
LPDGADRDNTAAVTVLQGSPAEPAAQDQGGRLISLRVKAVLIVAGLALLGFICFGIGTNHGKGSHVLVGRAHVSDSQGAVKAGDVWYGFNIDPNTMHWYDATGGFHEGGIPPCLQHAPQDAWIRFGYATAHGLHGDSWGVVTWLQCTHRP